MVHNRAESLRRDINQIAAIDAAGIIRMKILFYVRTVTPNNNNIIDHHMIDLNNNFNNK